MLDTHQKNIATFIHLSTFSRFLIPFGNFIGPIVLWVTNKEKSSFIDAHGKQAINFQISVFLYAVILGTLTIPFFIFNLFSGMDFISFNGFSDLNGGGRIDYLFVSEGIEVFSFEARKIKKDSLFISDHWPIIISLGLR